MYLYIGALQTSFFTVPQEVLEKTERFALRHFRKRKQKMLKKEKHIQHEIFWEGTANINKFIFRGCWTL